MDAFISYKWKDAKVFAGRLVERLTQRRLTIWQDDLNTRPGDSVVRGIEVGLRKATLLILVLSKNYFTGWSELERNAITHLFVADQRKIFPIWFDVDYRFVLTNAPLLADIKGFQVVDDAVPPLLVEQIAFAVNPDYVESRLLPLTEDELPPVPAGYEWYFARNVNIALAKPIAWFSKEIASKSDRAIVLSKEDTGVAGGRYETGLTLNIMTHVSTRFGLPADVHSLNLFRIGLSGPNYEVKQVSSKLLNGIETQSVTLLVKDPGLPDVVVRGNSFGMNELDMAFSVHWDTTVDKYTEQAKTMADVMLSHIVFAYDDDQG
jgi:hypothetical protein